MAQLSLRRSDNGLVSGVASFTNIIDTCIIIFLVSVVGGVVFFHPTPRTFEHTYFPTSSNFIFKDSLLLSEEDTTNVDSLLELDKEDPFPFPQYEEDIFTTPADSMLLQQDDIQNEKQDTVGLKSDTTFSQFLDSTWRVAQFVHKRYDSPVSQAFPKRQYSLYLDINSPAYKREIELDSAKDIVTIRETVNGLDVKVPLTMSLEDYIKQRFEYEKMNNWKTFVYEYRFKEGGDELAGLFGSITKIEIPVPANPLLSIFGRNVINLQITGAVDIRAAYRNQTSDRVTQYYGERSRSEPDFNQDVQINVNGTIGDKLNLLADWNTQRTFEYENQLRIKYTGFEDEIVQSVEAGNVSLQTPSLVGGGQALFGIKAKFQTGPMTLMTLLSQKKGQAREMKISGGAQQQTRVLYPADYSSSYFFVDTLYRKFFPIIHSEISPTYTYEMESNKIIEIEVWVSLTGNQINPNKGLVNAYIDLGAIRQGESYPPQLDTLQRPEPGRSETGYFVRLDPTQYKWHPHGGYIALNTSLNDDQALAVAYRTNGSDVLNPADDLFYGQFAGKDTAMNKPLILKLIKPARLQPAYRHAWKLQLRNIYPIGGRDLKKEGFSCKIYFKPIDADTTEEINGIQLLRLLDVDRYNETNARQPDNQFDYLPPLTINTERAEIIFPSLEPFDEALARNYLAMKGEVFPDTLRFRELYDTTRTAARINALNTAYSMVIISSTARSNRINLGSYNIVEGSVQVLLNGIPLQRDVDYTVDYIIGEIVIKNEQALVPAANLEVKYEQNELFQLAAKTLIGTRGELALEQNTKLGFTIMNLNQETLSDKVRIGEEPTNNTMFGIDGSTSFDLPFLTNALDALPLLRAKEMSTLRLSGEGAYMLPNPNTKKSPIASDKEASIAYIDDFEGARRTITFGIVSYSWKLSSPPARSLLASNLTPTDKTYRKAKLQWYNNTRDFDPVFVHEIWPNRYVRTGQDFVPVMHLNFQPTVRGMYNFSPNLDSTMLQEPQKNWNGIMRYIATTAGNLIEQNVNYLEVWVKATSNNINDLRRGRLYVNLGSISEDVVTNNQLNSEDIIRTPTNPTGIPNNVLNPGEDLGLDMIDNAEERRQYTDFLQRNSGFPGVDPNDPSGDDFAYTTGSSDFTRFNGPENNGLQGRGSPDGQYPNTEDLNGNGNVDLVDTYLEYEIPLDTVYIDSTGAIQNNPNIVGGGVNGWYQIRIPLLDATRIVPQTTTLSPQSILENVQYIRLWVSGFREPVTIRIAEINLVGNQWLELAKNDTVMKVSVINIEDNSGAPDYYTPPPGVIRERDRTQPDQEIFGNEQSLALIIRELPPKESRQAVRYYPQRQLDLFNYKALKMFVHGEPKFQYVNAEIFIRFGADTLNFYEYRQPLRPGWHEVSIIFSELTSIKAERDSVHQLYRRSITDGPPGATYGIRGNPALTQIRYIGIGITNQDSVNRLSGNVWVNELRVVDVQNTPGYAYRFDTQIRLSDFGSIALNFSTTSPDFHALDQRFGSRIRQQNWAVNTNFDIHKFLPQEWQGTTLPFGYSHVENLTSPRYLPSTDILVEEAAERAAEQASIQEPYAPGAAKRAADSVKITSQTFTVRESYTLTNVRIKYPWQAWYVKDILNNLNYGFTYTKSNERSPSIFYRQSWSWDFRIGHTVNFPTDNYLTPFKSLFGGIFFFDEFKDWKLYYLPFTNLSSGITAQRSRTTSQVRAANAIPQDNRNFAGGKTLNFGWKLTEGGLLNLGGDYGIQIQSDLLYFDNDTVGRDFWSILQSIFVRERNRQYGQRININSKPKIPNILDIPKYFDITPGYSVNYNWQNTFQSTDIGKSAGWTNAINVTSTFRLKALTDPWFKQTEGGGTQPPMRTRTSGTGKDTTTQTDTTQQSKKKNPLETLKPLAHFLIKIPFLDYESINISYTQNNTNANSGVVGNSGFMNFWGRLPFQGSISENGPSRLYQLGLIADPSGKLEYSPSSRFPFIGWKVVPGIRAPNAILTDQFSQQNKLSLRTNRPLWEGATLDLNWNVDWSLSRNTSVRTDSFGNPTPSLPTTSGSIGRSYFTIPPLLLFKVFKSDLETVGKKYAQYKQDRPRDIALAEAFEEGLEALPLLKKVLGPYVPRPNWSLRWSGLERIAGLSSVFQSLQLDHAYTSSFKRGFQGAPDGSERTLNESVNYGFSPLAGVNMTFKDFLKGDLRGSFRYATTTTYDLNLSVSNIVETNSKEFTLSLNYSRRGFELPLFGLSLKNDVDITLTYSTTYNARRQHDPALLLTTQEGTPLEGNTRTTLEPRLRYTLSARVSASVFYRYSSTKPDEGGSTIPGTTTNEAGLDIRITIQ